MAKKKPRRTQTQRKAFEFFRKHLQTQKPFTIAQFVAATGWTKPGTFKTYLAKQYRGLIEPIDAAKTRFRVTDAFWKFVSWRKFRGHVTQVRRVVASYEPNKSQIVIYDFLMPLTNEEHLRMTLDSLFYADRISARLSTIGIPTLKAGFRRESGERRDKYFARILDFIKNHFIGYSIYHVAGRFRSGTLLTQEQAAVKQQKTGERYLIDETTAVARFIFPYETDDEKNKIRSLFELLFIRSIIQLVNGEEQIWMVESGSGGSQLHRWERLSEEEEEEG